MERTRPEPPGASLRSPCPLHRTRRSETLTPDAQGGTGHRPVSAPGPSGRCEPRRRKPQRSRGRAQGTRDTPDCLALYGVRKGHGSVIPSSDLSCRGLSWDRNHFLFPGNVAG